MKHFSSFKDKGNNTIELSENDVGLVNSLYLSYNEYSSTYPNAGPISSLSGVEKFYNIERIFMWNNDLSDLLPLSSLRNLKLLDITGNNVSDISPVSNITALETLILDNNNISDISPISNLVNLKNFSISGNNVSTITSIGLIPELLSLRCDRNKISDISPVSNLENLYLLSANENNIEDLSPLTNLTNLTVLYLKKNKISNISNLANLTDLNELNLDNNFIEDLTPIKNNLIYTYFPPYVISTLTTTSTTYSFSAMNQTLSNKTRTSVNTIELPDILKKYTLKIDKTNNSMEVKIQDNKVEFYNANPGDKVTLTNENYCATRNSEITYTFIEDREEQLDVLKEVEIIQKQLTIKDKIINVLAVTDDNDMEKEKFIEDTFIIPNGCRVEAFDKNGNEIIDGKKIGSRSVITIYDENDNEVTSFTVVVKGDVTGNGEVKIYDAFKILVGTITDSEVIDEIEVLIRDYNNDGQVKIYDAFKFLIEAIS